MYIAIFTASIILTCCSQMEARVSGEHQPLVLGHAEGLVEVGELLYSDNFDNLDRWIAQIEEVTNCDHEPRLKTLNGVFDAFMPCGGTTVWFDTRIDGPVTILFDVVLPSTYRDSQGLVPRDLNMFWHASDPAGGDGILTTQDDLYNGAFVSYRSILGYYASLGGRENTSTRLRRYPRWDIGGQEVDEILLSHRDNNPDYRIVPNHIHRIQIVTFQDLQQFIVDGRVVYEIRAGFPVTVFTTDRRTEERIYDTGDFPVYEGGWFGFRMLRSHYRYSNFRVYRLHETTSNSNN